jgi:hypothetical protein
MGLSRKGIAGCTAIGKTVAGAGRPHKNKKNVT